MIAHVTNQTKLYESKMATSTHLHSLLAERHTPRQLLAHERVRVVRALEDALQCRQLLTVERRAVATRLLRLAATSASGRATLVVRARVLVRRV